MSQSSAKVICDSISPAGDRVTSIEGLLNRFALAELNTHRLISRPEADAPLFMEEFSRNSASSRAIPVRKQLDRVANDPALPVSWPAEQKGMQGGEELAGVELTALQNIWSRARVSMVNDVQQLARIGLHKSVTNRLLEPFMWHTVVLTATNWQGFFDQRLDKNAQPEIRVFAEALKEAYDNSTPTELSVGEWHLPYITNEDREWAAWKDPDCVLGASSFKSLVRISTARCARTSYLTQDGIRDVAEDLALYDRLRSASPVHYSPAEHVCRPEPGNHDELTIRPSFGEPAYTYCGPRYGNLTGWHQHRFDMMSPA